MRYLHAVMQSYLNDPRLIAADAVFDHNEGSQP